MAPVEQFTFSSIRVDEKRPLATGDKPAYVATKPSTWSRTMIAAVAIALTLVAVGLSIGIAAAAGAFKGDTANQTVSPPPPAATAATAGFVFSPNSPPPAAPGCCTEPADLTEHPCPEDAAFSNGTIPKCMNVGIGEMCEDEFACSGDNHLNNCHIAWDWATRVDCQWPPSPPSPPPLPPSPAMPGCCTKLLNTTEHPCPPNSDFVSGVIRPCEQVGLGEYCEDGACVVESNAHDSCGVWDYAVRIDCRHADPPPPSSPAPPASPPPPPGSPSTPPGIVCNNLCVGGIAEYDTGNGLCDDGGPGSEYALCAAGTDCTDCGERQS